MGGFMTCTLLKVLAFSCAVAAAGACNGRASNIAKADTGDRGGDAASGYASTTLGDLRGQPISVTGCLQKTGPTGDLVLIPSGDALHRAGDPERAVGTSGTSGTGAGAARSDRTRVAAASYRIDPPTGFRTDGMIGRQVRVIGRLDDAGSIDRRSDPANIGEDDLAEIDASSISLVSEICGRAAARKAQSR